MKKTLAFFIFFAIKFCVAQSKTNFEFVFRYRLAPIYKTTLLGNNINYNPFYTYGDAQITGLSLVTGFEHNLSNSFFLTYQLATRYADVFAKNLETAGLNEQVKKFLFDHTFAVNYKIINKPKMSLAIGLGTSLCNTNSKYVYTKQTEIAGLPGQYYLVTPIMILTLKQQIFLLH